MSCQPNTLQYQAYSRVLTSNTLDLISQTEYIGERTVGHYTILEHVLKRVLIIALKH